MTQQRWVPRTELYYAAAKLDLIHKLYVRLKELHAPQHDAHLSDWRTWKILSPIDVNLAAIVMDCR